MTMSPQRCVMLIPSLEPDERLPKYVQALLDKGFETIVVVDDGSSEAFQAVFRQLEEMQGCHVLHHDVNHGKGVALKTGYAWIRDNCPEATGVITADADGQHTVEDCWKLAEALATGKRALYLGSRDFSLPHVPPRSRTGNRITSVVFKLLHGVWLTDTQTGLRAFLMQDLPFMLNVEGERYEYEMNVLIACAREKLPMVPITIETVYENNNEGSHFHPIKDSMKIYKVIFRSFIRFTGAALLCFLIDWGLEQLFAGVVFRGLAHRMRIGVANLLARVLSSVCNFTLNRNVVFKQKSNLGGAIWKYALLCVVVLCASIAGQWLLTGLGMAEWLAKPLCDIILYLLNFRIQNKWVFKEAK
ncbi:MAG: bifunctional glycosyltransferase family 2/GtrA family protein [Clostridia bacterium]|nr:bifunctional glycosyltransferase family 2/GtrA family protein [Clostridia bacterium]